MPIYEYVCEECSHEFEERTQSIFDGVREHCPCCGNPTLKQKFPSTPPTALYKGAGFKTTEARGITGRKRKPNIKVGLTADLPPEEREKHGG